MHINGLPLDILRTVFDLSREKSDQGSSIASDEQTRAILCSVCRLWRTVALQDPLLWNILCFVETEAALRRTERNIRLSGTVPLDIYMIPPRKKGNEAYYPQFMDLIEPQSYRWRTLEVQNIYWARGISCLWDGQTPMLERLSILGGDLDCSVALPLPRLGPGVRFLSVSQFPLCWDNWSCASLTHLTLGYFSPHFKGPSVKSFYGVLSAVAGQLASLTLQNSWHTTPDEVLPKGHTTLKALKRLCIWLSWTVHIQRLLEKCRLPSLVHLDAGLLSGPFSPSLVRLLSEEPRLFQSVKRFTINGFLESISPTERSCIDVLQHAFPNAEHAGPDSSVNLYLFEADLLLASWGFITQMNIRRAELSEVQELLSRRFSKYATPLRELKIERLGGTLYREDYEWICSHVDLFIIQGAQNSSESLWFSKDVIIFEERDEK